MARAIVPFTALLVFVTQTSLAAPPHARKAKPQSSMGTDASVPAASASNAAPELLSVPSSLGPAESYALVTGVAVEVRPPAGWTGVASDTSWFKADDIAGSTLVLGRTWSLQTPGNAVTSSRPVAFHLTCVTAPSTDWVPGLETIVFERMSSVVKTQVAERISLDAFESLPVEEDGLLHWQRFRLRGDMGGRQREGNVSVVEEDKPNAPRVRLSGNGRHVIGFVGAAERLFACTALCFVPERSGSRLCDDAIGSMRFSGELSAEPAPSFWMRLMMSLHKRPWPWGGLLAGLLFITLGVFCIGRAVTLRRPRAQSIT